MASGGLSASLLLSSMGSLRVCGSLSPPTPGGWLGHCGDPPPYEVAVGLTPGQPAAEEEVPRDPQAAFICRIAREVVDPPGPLPRCSETHDWLAFYGGCGPFSDQGKTTES